MHVFPFADLGSGTFSRELQGKDAGNPGASLILVDAEPGRGPGLHTHPYAEVFVVQAGAARFDDGRGTSVDIGAGHVVVVPAGEPHAFTAIGSERLRQVDVHLADAFDTRWL